MQKSRRQLVSNVLVTLFIGVIIFHRLVKIVQKEERKQREAESVVAKTVWHMRLPAEEFIGDLSQVGDYLVFSAPESANHGAFQTFARRLDNGVITPIESQGSPHAEDPQVIGHSLGLKKEFRIEREGNDNVVAQYHVTTKERGIIAILPTDCTQFKTVQRLPQNFFALEGLCACADVKKHGKRVMVVELESRRLTYVSDCLPKSSQIVGLTTGTVDKGRR